MGKSIRCKLKKRLRAAKRGRVDAMVLTPKLKLQHENLLKVMQGRAVTLKTPMNAFKYPASDGSVFPQKEMMVPIDYRCDKLPMAQYAFRGNRRKYSGDELEMMKALATEAHPKYEVLAGGGAILAKTGKRISIKEAEIITTRAVDPEAAALAEAGPANSYDAVAAAVAEDAEAGDDDDGCDEDMESNELENAADHTRIPIAKDNRRAKRTADKKPRANKTSVKTKGLRKD